MRDLAMIRMLKCPSSTTMELQTSDFILRHLMGQSCWASLGTQEKLHIESFHWSTRSFEKGNSLIAQGAARNTISILLSGWAFRFQALPEGKRQILDFVFAGTLLGFGSGNANWYGCEAVTTCTVASLQYSQFRRLLSGCPTLAIQVAERVADSEMRAHEHMTSLGRRTARERVAALIVELMTRTRSPKLGFCAGTLELPVTQMMIGDALGLSNEHVCRTLAKLADEGIIELGRHALRVKDPAAVCLAAGKDLADAHNRKDLQEWAA
jgi:CRP/FNR family transcriptional regulator, anaerobic regulatory protein